MRGLGKISTLEHRKKFLEEKFETKILSHLPSSIISHPEFSAENPDVFGILESLTG